MSATILSQGAEKLEKRRREGSTKAITGDRSETNKESADVCTIR